MSILALRDSPNYSSIAWTLTDSPSFSLLHVVVSGGFLLILPANPDRTPTNIKIKRLIMTSQKEIKKNHKSDCDDLVLIN